MEYLSIGSVNLTNAIYCAHCQKEQAVGGILALSDNGLIETLLVECKACGKTMAFEPCEGFKVYNTRA